MEARFNVAIRTVTIDAEKGVAAYGAGGGITHYSSADAEYDEYLLKTRILTERRPDFRLLETLLFEAERGYYLLDRHLARLAESARYFDFLCDPVDVKQRLADHATGLRCRSVEPSGGETVFRVRLTVSRQGDIDVASRPVARRGSESFRARVADMPVDSGDPFLYHKTTHRAVYDERLARHPDCDEVVLHNERGEVTECCTANLVVVAGGERWTPSRESGLLAGTYRAELLEAGELMERVISLEELAGADAVFAINSVRRWIRLELVGEFTSTSGGRACTG